MGDLLNELRSLCAEAFLTAEANDATKAIEQARERFAAMTGTDAFSFEIVAPHWPLPGWVGNALVRPLVYFCVSTGRPPPVCAGVFVTLFLNGRIYFLPASHVIEWAARQLGLSPVDLLARYGTHEQSGDPSA